MEVCFCSLAVRVASLFVDFSPITIGREAPYPYKEEGLEAVSD